MINRTYLERVDLQAEVLGRSHIWLDTSTCESLLEAFQFVRTVERHQGYRVACLEKTAYNKSWPTFDDLKASVAAFGKSHYADYPRELAR